MKGRCLRKEEGASSHIARRTSPFTRGARARVRESLLLTLLACLAVAFILISNSDTRGVGSIVSAAAVSSPPPPGMAQPEGDYSKFSHASTRHAALACDSCHRRASDNSIVPRLPGHKACTDCHLPQFVTPSAPLCVICHTSVEGENPPVKNFPGIRSFNARFDHAQHGAGAARPAEGCAACHQPFARRAAAVTIPASFNAHTECYTCHAPGAQSSGRDLASCGVCHELGKRFFRTPTIATSFRVGFSHAAHGSRQRLGCADCHQTRGGLPQSQQVTSTRPLEHFPASRAQNCATCHNSRRAFGDADFNDCRRCHKGQTFRAGA